MGLESDGSISLSKGVGRPVFRQKVRAEVIAELSSVDYVFKIRKVYGFKSSSVESYFDGLLRDIHPDVLITHISKDTSLKPKMELTEKHGIRLLLCRENPLTASTEIVEKIKRLD